jgi:membrane fusion protein (multidrug efflux system)
MRTFVSMVIVVAVAAFLGGAWWLFMGAKAQPGGGPGAGGPPGGFAMPVEAGPVKVGQNRRDIVAIGSLRSNESVVVRPELAGRVVEIGFAEGQRVRKGQVVVRFESSIERAELAQAQASLALSKANFERAEELLKRGAGTQRTLDEARWKLRNDQAAITLVQARLEKLVINAPFDGVAGLRRVSLGDFVNVGADIVNLEMIDPLKVDFRVPEIFLSAVRNGQPIEVGVDAYPELRFPGEVYAIDPQIDTAGRSIVIRARITNPDDKLRPGLFARVTLTLAVRENAVFIPEESLIPVGNQHFVLKLIDPPAGATVPQGAKMAKNTLVKLGDRRKGEVEIVEGLAPGDIVVTAGVLKVRDGMPVQPMPTPPVAAAPTAAR